LSIINCQLFIAPEPNKLEFEKGKRKIVKIHKNHCFLLYKPPKKFSYIAFYEVKW